MRNLEDTDAEFEEKMKKELGVAVLAQVLESMSKMFAGVLVTRWMEDEEETSRQILTEYEKSFRKIHEDIAADLITSADEAGEMAAKLVVKLNESMKEWLERRWESIWRPTAPIESND